MTNEQNQMNTMEEFVRRHGYVYFGERTIGRQNQPTLSADVESSPGQIGAQAREDFFRIHDRFEQANHLYQNFQREYSSIDGELETEHVRDLYNILGQIREIGIGDINGIFTPLEISENGVYQRLSRPLQASAVPYFMFPENVRESYRERLLPIFSQISRVGCEENYEVSTVPEEYLWNLHVQPRDFFNRLNAVLRLENMAPYVNDNITAYEYAKVLDRERDYCFVESRFAENAAEELHGEYPEMAIDVVVPSLHSFRRLLPQELQPCEMFGLAPLGNLRQNLLNLTITNLFDSYRSEATQNGWLG